MSYLDTKKALTTKLFATSITGITSADIAEDNSNFDPDGKAKYIGAYFMPTIAESTGKTTASGDEQRGMFQISVFVKLNGGNYDNDQLQIIDDLRLSFVYGSTVAYNGQRVDILETQVNEGRPSGAWFQRDITIDYLTFSERT